MKCHSHYIIMKMFFQGFSGYSFYGLAKSLIKASCANTFKKNIILQESLYQKTARVQTEGTKNFLLSDDGLIITVKQIKSNKALCTLQSVFLYCFLARGTPNTSESHYRKSPKSLVSTSFLAVKTDVILKKDRPPSHHCYINLQKNTVGAPPYSKKSTILLSHNLKKCCNIPKKML